MLPTLSPFRESVETSLSRQETSAEGRQTVVIGMKIGGDEAEGHRVVGCLFQPAAGEAVA
jgi:hypothetical protein